VVGRALGRDLLQQRLTAQLGLDLPAPRLVHRSRHGGLTLIGTKCGAGGRTCWCWLRDHRRRGLRDGRRQGSRWRSGGGGRRGGGRRGGCLRVLCGL